uniref:glutathione transferase n=1 Tax=Anopheles atroparvus TaxID=41427 RepID=A0A182JB98_ANOAO
LLPFFLLIGNGGKWQSHPFDLWNILFCSVDEWLFTGVTFTMDTPSMVLFYDDVSPPVRSVLLAIAALGVKDQVKLEYVNLFAGGHLSTDFLKVNPLHTVPVLRHGDLTLTDSHAILVYLCDTFASEGDDLAISDARTRAQVVNRLCFNNGFLFQRDAEIMRKIFRGDVTDVSAHYQPLEQILDVLEQYLSGSPYTALDRLSVADFSIVATVSTLALIMPVRADRWPNIHGWFERMKALPYYETANATGLEKLRQKLSTKITV